MLKFPSANSFCPANEEVSQPPGRSQQKAQHLLQEVKLISPLFGHPQCRDPHWTSPPDSLWKQQGEKVTYKSAFHLKVDI